MGKTLRHDEEVSFKGVLLQGKTNKQMSLQNETKLSLRGWLCK